MCGICWAGIVEDNGTIAGGGAVGSDPTGLVLGVLLGVGLLLWGFFLVGVWI